MAVKCVSPSLLMSASNSGRGRCSTGSISSAGSLAGCKASTDLLREAATLASMRHPNIVAVYGVVLPPTEAFLQEPAGGSSGPDRPGWGPDKKGACISGPAMVCEYMSAGSLQSAIRSGADWLKNRMVKAKIMLDTGRVSLQRCVETVKAEQSSTLGIIGFIEKNFACPQRLLPCAYSQGNQHELFSN